MAQMERSLRQCQVRLTNNNALRRRFLAHSKPRHKQCMTKRMQRRPVSRPTSLRSWRAHLRNAVSSAKNSDLTGGRVTNRMQPQPFLELAGISLRANNRILFRNTRWTFFRNQNWALIGRNGSGKTLLARALAGEVPVIKGEIRYNFRLPDGELPEDCVRLVSFEQQKAVAGDAPAAARWFSLEQDEAASVCSFLSQESVEEINPFEVKPHREQTAACISTAPSKDPGVAANSASAEPFPPLFIEWRNAKNIAGPCTAPKAPAPYSR